MDEMEKTDLEKFTEDTLNFLANNTFSGRCSLSELLDEIRGGVCYKNYFNKYPYLKIRGIGSLEYYLKEAGFTLEKVYKKGSSSIVRATYVTI